MTQLTSLIREIMPDWLWRRAEQPHRQPEASAEPARPEEADAVWRKAVDKNLFGANTPDFAETTAEIRSDRH